MSTTQKDPALLVLVAPQWIEEALEEFKSGKRKIYFGTNSQLGGARKQPLGTVYFKPSERTCIVAKARLIDILEKNSACPPAWERLASGESEAWKYYHGFDQLEMLPAPIALSSLRRYPSGKIVRNDFPGVCVIEAMTGP